MPFSISAIRMLSETGGQNDQGVYYTQIWQVDFAGGYAAAAIKNATATDGTYGDLPKYLTTKPDDSLAYVSDIKVELEDNEGGEDVGTAKYTVTYAQKSITFDPNPLSRPPEIEWGGTDLTEVPTKDVTGAALLNSSGLLYEGLPDRPVRGAADVTITRNESANPASTVTGFSYTVNSAAWYGVAIGNGVIGKITARKKQEQVSGLTVVYWQVTYPIRFRKDTWRLKPIDCGYAKVVSSAPRRHTDDMGNAFPHPVLLDGHGNVLASGSAPVIFPTNGNPSAHVGDGYQILDETDWSTLSLPNPFL